MDFERYPGGSLVRQGLEDLAAGRETDAALLVLVGAPRLMRLGISVPTGPARVEHRLFERLGIEIVVIEGDPSLTPDEQTPLLPAGKLWQEMGR